MTEAELFAAFGMAPLPPSLRREETEHAVQSRGIIGVAGPSSAEPNTMPAGRQDSARTGAWRPLALRRS